jgi:hypothetical protein
VRGPAILVTCSCCWVGYRGWGLVSVISGERGTVRLAVVYIPRHTDYLRCGSWTELH